MKNGILSALVFLGTLACASLAQAAGNMMEVNAGDYKPYAAALYSKDKSTIHLYVDDDCATCGAAIEQLKRLAPKHARLQFVIVHDNDFVYPRHALRPQLTALSLSDGWISDQHQNNRSDAEVDTFLSVREAFGKKERLAQARVDQAQKRVDAALAPQARELARLAKAIERYNDVLKPVGDELHKQQQAGLQHFMTLKRDARDAEWKALDEQETKFATDYAHLGEQLANARYALVGPLEKKIEQIKQQAASKQLKSLSDAQNVLGEVLDADRHDAWKSRPQ